MHTTAKLMKTTKFSNMLLLLRYLRPQWYTTLLMAMILLLSIGLQLLVPQILRKFIDESRSGSPTELLFYLALSFLGVSMINQVFSIAATWLSSLVGWTATNALREDLMTHCLSLDMKFHNEKTAGEMIERIDGDVLHLSNFFSQFIINIIGNGILCIGILIILCISKWEAGLVLSLFAFSAMILLYHNRTLAVPSSRVQREISARLFGFLEEKLSALDDIRANGGGWYILNRFYSVNRQFYFKTRYAWMIRTFFFVFIMAIFTIGDILALACGAWFYKSGLITLGTVFLYFQYTDMLRRPIEQITRQMQDFQNASASIGRIHELLSKTSKLPEGTESILANRGLHILFNSVSFGYNKGNQVLKDVSFTIHPGEKIGLLGRTGGGKTTIIRLLFRLYDIKTGQIAYNGINIKNITHHSLKKNIAMVTQEVQLFNATVRDNITFFNRSVPDTRIHQIVTELGLKEWFEKLPHNLDTMLSSKGGGLSAGEAQLIAFIRIFLQDPVLIVMDEPSSRLDPETERLLQRAIGNLIKGRTAIIVAHRLSTVEHVDRIFILEQGEIIENGLRTALMDDPQSYYHALLKKSFKKEIG